MIDTRKFLAFVTLILGIIYLNELLPSMLDPINISYSLLSLILILAYLVSAAILIINNPKFIGLVKGLLLGVFGVSIIISIFNLLMSLSWSSEIYLNLQDINFIFLNLLLVFISRKLK